MQTVLDTLVDADLAKIVFNWQWVFGSVLMPRLFLGSLIRHFKVKNLIRMANIYVGGCPINQIKDQSIHQPPSTQSYSTPIIDHQIGRNRALDYYQKMKKRALIK